MHTVARAGARSNKFSASYHGSIGFYPSTMSACVAFMVHYHDKSSKMGVNTIHTLGALEPLTNAFMTHDQLEHGGQEGAEISGGGSTSGRSDPRKRPTVPPHRPATKPPQLNLRRGLLRLIWH